ncbi:MAG: hypothetical protein L6R35_006581 [Caloplaca aegaea]|nr:MAG: hypothetical protein L6R35_006581 [Caloplaca aegaea]
MVEDARRFILNNRGLIEEAPLQAYASALVFAPSESLIRNCYLDQQPSWLNQHPTVERRWGNYIQTVKLFDCVSSLAFSPDGKYIIAGLEDGEIKLLNAATGALHSILEGHHGEVTTTMFMHNGSLASVSEDGTLRLWEPVTGVNRRTMDIDFRLRKKLKSPLDSIRSTNTSPGPLFLQVPAEPSLSVLPSGDLAVLCLDGRLRIWSSDEGFLSDPILPDIRTSHLYGCLPQGTLVIRTEGTQEDESGRPASEGSLGHESAAGLLLLDPSTRAAVERIEFDPLGLVDKVAVSSANIVALGLFDGRIMLYHIVARSFIKLGVHAGGVQALAFSPDGSILVSDGWDSKIRSWIIKKQVQSLIGSYSSSPGRECVALSPDSKQTVTSRYNSQSIQIWDISLASTEIPPESPPAAPTMWIELSPCGKYVATKTQEDDRVIRLHNTKTMAEFIMLDHHDKVLDMAFSSDDGLLASASSDEIIRLWNTSTGVAGVMLGHELGFVTALVFSPDGKYLASANRSGEVRIWDPVSGDLQCVFKPREGIQDITFSVDGKQVAVLSGVIGGESRSLDLWDIGMQQLLYHTDDASSHTPIAFSHDSRNFAYTTENTNIVLYDMELKEQRSMRGYFSRAMAFSKDDKLLATCYWDAVHIKLWSTKTLQSTHVIHAHHNISRLSFTPDGTFLDTNIGLLQIAEPEVESFADSRSVWRRDGEWMMEGSRKMLWLPHDWRPLAWMHYNGVFVFKKPLGFGFLDLPQGGPVPGIE